MTTVSTNLTISKIKPAGKNVSIQKLQSSTADVAQLAEFLSTMHEVQDLTPVPHKSGAPGEINKLCHGLSHGCDSRALLHK